MPAPSRDLLRRVVELATRAPSVHNSQPWLWRIVDESTVELYADRARQLQQADPDGRNLMISCGAVLQHAQEVAEALGLLVSVHEPEQDALRDLLAVLAFAPGRPAGDAADRLRTLEQRCTDRRRFTSWPVPDARLTELADAAQGWEVQAVPLNDVTARFRAELLIERALTVQAGDRRYAEEQASWVENGRQDGMPLASASPPSSGRRLERPSRFRAWPRRDEHERVVESTDGLMALCTADDDRSSWLRAGQALSALWLHATRIGLSIVPLSQVVEVAQTRDALRDEVFAGLTRPQLLLRVGWQEIARTTLPRTARRPVDDVLLR